MKCLVDADLLLYEACFVGEYKDEETGETITLPFDNVADSFEERLKVIEDECWVNEPSLLFITGNPFLHRMVTRKKEEGDEGYFPYRDNFRFEAAQTVPYKSKRGRKPYHYYNLLAYIVHHHSPIIAWGCEADDKLAEYQDTEGLTTILCSRDKDLVQVPGMQFRWEVGNQAAWGPVQVDKLGDISLPKPNKLVGTGLKFFFSQMITGDAVDTIPGLRGCGPKKAFDTLEDCTTEEQMYEAVATLYEEKIGEDWETYFKEQSSLLWMVREWVDEEPTPYQPPLRLLQSQNGVHED